MKKSFLLISSIFMTLSVFGLQVNTDELKNAKNVQFVNYEGNPAKRDSSFSVRYIGTRLSRVREANRIFPYFLKYAVIHAVTNDEPEKLDADIFIVEKDAKANHIKDIRMILSGFSRGRYGYSQKDADTLAYWITLYNAVYQGNLEYFSGIYKQNVTRFISKDNAGILLRYDQWPGKTRMLIPLTEDAAKGGLNALNSSILSDEKVKTQLRSQPDKGIDEREKLTDLKERQVEEKKSAVQRDEEKLKEEKKQTAEEEKKITSDEKEIAKKEEDLKKQEATAEKITDPEKKQEAAKQVEEKKHQLQEEKKNLEEKKQEIKETKEEITKKEEKLEEKKQEIIQKEKEIQQDKKEIAQDKESLKQTEEKSASLEEKKESLEKKEQQLTKKEKDLEKREEAVINKEEKDIFSGKLYYLKNMEYTVGGHYYNKLLMIDAATRQVEKESPLKTISGRKFDIFADGIVVIAQEGTEKEVHHLVVINRDSLAPLTFGRDNIFWRSFVEIREDFIYAIIKEKDSYYLGKFNAKMGNVARSKVPIHEDSFISFYGDWIYVNGADRKILVLKKEDLSLSDTIKP